MPDITTFLTYNDQAETAVHHYVSIFDGKILSESRSGDAGPGAPGSVFTMTFQILGKTFIALNGGPSFKFAEGISLFVGCDTQEEVDRFWEKLGEGGKEVQCGWLVDKFGVSWQVVPKVLPELLGGKDRAGAGRALQAMLKMKKLDIAALRRAYDGS
jgi:predicted 3-demethylubiquinone-9 3-methyltransferase (glyoxalase superfamily)